MNLQRGLRSKARRFTPPRLASAVRALREKDVLFVDWVNRGPVSTNWGDAIAPHLVEELSGRPVVNQRDVLNLAHRPVYTTIGSMLGSVTAQGVTVWGSGFVNSGLSMKAPPRQVCAVRGPLTRSRLLETGIECPEVFGDPALLYPYIYRPPQTREFRLGVIPHFKETEMPSARRFSAEEGVLVIDIRAGITEVADQINRCESIASASLHGLVAGHAYGIPSIWIRFSDRPGGDGFKFRDYLESVGHDGDDPLVVDSTTTAEEVLARFTFDGPRFNLDRFLSVCPFLDEAVWAAKGAVGT